MTQSLLSMAPDLEVPNQDKGEKCKWAICKKSHKSTITYPGGGTVARNSTFEDAWKQAGLEPWTLYRSNGKKSFVTTNSSERLKDYRKETPKAKYAIAASRMQDPEYHTQKHHLISVNLFKGVQKLSKNAQLIGYDVNHKNNGVCLPTYELDIVRHDLQCHRGSHPNNFYNSKIKPNLEGIEVCCIVYCRMDWDCDTKPQARLIDDLNALSRRILRQIKAWKWLVRTNALTERVEAYARQKAMG